MINSVNGLLTHSHSPDTSRQSLVPGLVAVSIPGRRASPYLGHRLFRTTPLDTRAAARVHRRQVNGPLKITMTGVWWTLLVPQPRPTSGPWHTDQHRWRCALRAPGASRTPNRSRFMGRMPFWVAPPDTARRRGEGEPRDECRQARPPPVAGEPRLPRRRVHAAGVGGADGARNGTSPSGR